MNDMILILNYSDEFAVEAAKRLRGERVFCKIISGMTTAAQVAEIAPRGLVLCGEPKSAAGVFDAQTRAAVLTFQARRGLDRDGIAGGMTWGALLDRARP